MDWIGYNFRFAEIRASLPKSKGLPVLQRPTPCPRASVRVPFFLTADAAILPSLRLREELALWRNGGFALTEQRSRLGARAILERSFVRESEQRFFKPAGAPLVFPHGETLRV